MAAKTKAAKEASDDAVIVSYKGFDSDLSCRGFKFEIGGSYEHAGKVKACEGGFHACESPLDVFEYYAPGTSRYCTVTQSGQISRHADDTKIASGKITIEAELKIPDFVAACVAWVVSHCTPAESKHAEGDRSAASSTGDRSAASSTGYLSAASSTGDRSAASSTGDRSAASSTGYLSAASSTGYLSAASSTGYLSAASSTGDRSAAMSSGAEGRVMGKKGCALFLVYRNPETWEIEHAWAGIAGANGIKPETWYTLDSSGQPVEAQ